MESVGFLSKIKQSVNIQRGTFQSVIFNLLCYCFEGTIGFVIVASLFYFGKNYTIVIEIILFTMSI